MSENFYDHIQELCLLIAPRDNGIEDGPSAKGTGIAGAGEITGIGLSILSKIVNGYQEKFRYQDAEVLIQAAFPFNETEQSRYRAMEGYPDTPAQIVLERIAADLPIQKPLPELTELFEAAVRIWGKTISDLKTPNASEYMQERVERFEKPAHALLKEMGFANGLDRDFVIQAHEEIQNYARRITELNKAIFAMMCYPKIHAEESGHRNGWREKNITQPEIAEAVGKSRSWVNSVINSGHIASLSDTKQVIQFFQEEIGDILAANVPLGISNTTPWNEQTFYDYAKILQQRYVQCRQPEKTGPSAGVIEWGNSLDALIKVLAITEYNISDATKKDSEGKPEILQVTINSYRRNKTASGPGRKAKDAVQAACGCESDNEFLEYGAAAQKICALREAAKENKILKAFRQSQNLTLEQLEKITGIPATTLLNAESGTRNIENPESFTAKLGFRSPDYLLREFQHFVAEQVPAPTTAEESYAIGSVFRSLRAESMPAEFYFYQLMDLKPNPADFEAIAELRQKITPLYPHLQQQRTR